MTQAKSNFSPKPSSPRAQTKPAAARAHHDIPEKSTAGDAILLRLIAEWQVTRAQCGMHWAKSDLETLFGTLADGSGVPIEALDRMFEIEDLIKEMKPHTVIGALRMIAMALAILRRREYEPDANFARGPAVEILGHAFESLTRLPDDLIMDYNLQRVEFTYKVEAA